MFDNKSLNNIQIFCCMKFLVLSKLLNFITKHSKNIYRKRQNSSSAIAPKLWLPTVLWKVIRVSHSKWRTNAYQARAKWASWGQKNRGNDKQRGQKKGGLISEGVHILKPTLYILELFMKSKTKKVLGVFK